ncbi:MAG: type II toxin-antitoxin system VapC family toxin [Pirellulaceae bacterium]|nr:type II toxin-antitoxin system VapC family toxin [Pirellulaceae bacterium]
MSGSYLLDTNFVISILNGSQPAIRDISDADAYYVSSTVVGELYYGAFKSTHVNQNLEKIGRFLDCISSLPCDAGTSQIYGSIKAALMRKGKPIPENDLWIAATALQHSLTLATFDAHFGIIDGILLKLNAST